MPSIATDITAQDSTAQDATAQNSTVQDKTAQPEATDSNGITILNPRTGDVLWTVPEAEPAAVTHAVEVARRASAEWALARADRSRSDRRDQLSRRRVRRTRQNLSFAIRPSSKTTAA